MKFTEIAIIGSGPTGLYTLAGLMRSDTPLRITVFEAEAVAGKGMPYQPLFNDKAMLANIASIEIPPLTESLSHWLHRQDDADLSRLGIIRSAIDDRQFYPRLVLGEYFQSQLSQLVEIASQRGHVVDVKPLHHVSDLALLAEEIRVVVDLPGGGSIPCLFDHVVMATGHSWPEEAEIAPGYFVSPWPSSILESIDDCHVGILGTSLSAIDALVTVALQNGIFYIDAAGILAYQPSSADNAFRATMMSRKGLLPEADFYFPIPYASLEICNETAIDKLIKSGSEELLDEVFALFKEQLLFSDPEYCAKIGLFQLTVETFAAAYFADRTTQDPFLWASLNLAQAENDQVSEYTVPWRYAILRMHEVVARAVPEFTSKDLERFHKHFKTIFIDNYATVPHESIKRILALRQAGKLDILRLESDYKLDRRTVNRGAVVTFADTSRTFDAFIDATGQSKMSIEDFPFPTLVEQGVVNAASTPVSQIELIREPSFAMDATSSISLDASYRLQFTAPLCNNLYCVSLSFLLDKFPFIQGITSAQELGTIVSRTILDNLAAEQRPAPTVRESELSVS